MPGLRLMAVHAHPDDESSKGAASVARTVAEGNRVLVVTCTGGERGDVLNPAFDRAVVDELIAAGADPLDAMVTQRRREMARAASILGVEHAWLGFEDSGLPEGDPLPPLPAGCFADLPLEDTVEPLVRLVREFRPHVMTTYDERGGYPHPDHIRTHEVSIAAFEAAGDPDRFPDSGEPWQPLKLYYHANFTKARVEQMHQAILELTGASPFTEWLERWDDRPEEPERITTRIECAEYFEVRRAALVAHATQVDPSGPWFALPVEVEARIWSTEDYQLARSLVDTDLPEDDLFAGIPVSGGALVSPETSA